MEHLIKGKSGKEYLFDLYPIDEVLAKKVRFPDGDAIVIVLRQAENGYELVEYKFIRSNPAVVLNNWNDERLCIRHYGSTHLGVLRNLSYYTPRNVEDDILMIHRALCGLEHPYYGR